MKRYLPAAFLAALLFANVSIWSLAWAQAPEEGLLFAVLDVGQGDALYVRSPSGVEVLIDGGRNDGALLRELSKVMRTGDRRLDVGIATHPDADHLGGFLELFERYEVGSYVEPGIEKRTALTDALKEAVEEEGAVRYRAKRGLSLDLGGGAQLDVLFPDIDVSYFGERTNDGSVVARLVYGDTSVLLTGDATFWTEERMLLIASSSELKSDILKVGHHGSKYSTGETFVKTVAPSIAVISVGARNTYGHPAPRVLQLLEREGISVLRTDEEGTLVFYSDGTQFTRR